ncbi:MAG: glutamate---cysteine ligase / carboxylate-amine ligase [Kribbellaceae bacterium]|nr:glutamate---cysteine ligase / carboxylate-amine ligase [Kribbellaceae bacterium]
MNASHPSMGVEEEFLLVSATGRPLPRSVGVARAADGIDVQLELTKGQVEINSPVCDSSSELREHLVRMRSALAKAAGQNGARLLAVGVPPGGKPVQIVTDTPRYQRMADEYGQLAREQAVCGCHVHIEVLDRDAAIQASNHIRPWLPTLLALTANSPIYLGSDTGFASWRWIMASRWPVAGPPPYFECAAHYDAVVATQLAAGSIFDEQMVYWDIRPSVHVPTVEVRVSDVPGTVDETVLLATLVRALVMTATDAKPAPVVEPEVLRAGYWIAARDGLSGDGLDVLEARVLPMSELLDLLVQHVRPALEELGELKNVEEGLRHVLADGNGAIRQRRPSIRATTWQTSSL